MAREDLVIRIAGEAGEGVAITGQMVTQATARAGYYVLTDSVPPAEIKGGYSFYQIRLGEKRLRARGDSLDFRIGKARTLLDARYARHRRRRPGEAAIQDLVALTVGHLLRDVRAIVGQERAPICNGGVARHGEGINGGGVWWQSEGAVGFDQSGLAYAITAPGLVNRISGLPSPSMSLINSISAVACGTTL